MKQNKQRVYLAGGMKSDWQNIVLNRLSNFFIFYNPQDHNLEKETEYTIWDLHFVKSSDIIFAYMAKDNPSGYGLTLEIGYACALNKTIILIDERSKIDTSFNNHFKIVRESASIVFEDLEDGLRFLERFSIYAV